MPKIKLHHLLLMLSLLSFVGSESAEARPSKKELQISKAKAAKAKGKGKAAKNSKKNPKKNSGKASKQAKGKGKKQKKGQKKKGLSFGAYAGGAMETLKANNADREADAFNGFGFYGMLAAEYPILGCCSVWAGGGLHIGSYSAQNELAATKISTTSISLDGGLAYDVNPSFKIGGIFEYLILMSGSYSAESLDEAIEFSLQTKISSASRIGFGGQAVYSFTPNIRLSADAMITSGSIATEPGEEATSEESTAAVGTSGMVFRGMLGYFF